MSTNLTFEEMSERDRDYYRLKITCKVLSNLEKIRIQQLHRMGLKENGQKQKGAPERALDDEAMDYVREIYDEIKGLEKKSIERIERIASRLPVCTEFLDHIPGIGPKSAGRLLGELDIEKSTYISSLNQYCGVNPGMVKGMKDMTKKEYEEGKYKEIIEEVKREYTSLDGTERIVVLTNVMIRGDKQTKGFVRPYNAECKKQLLGVVGVNLMRGNFYRTADGEKAPGKYRLMYERCKERLENSEKWTKEVRKNKKTGETENVDVMWKDTSKGHRDQAAIRFMCKGLLRDLYENWRALEGLPVHKPYEEEKLGIKHNSRRDDDEERRQSKAAG